MFNGSPFNTDNNEQHIQKAILDQMTPLTQGEVELQSTGGVVHRRTVHFLDTRAHQGGGILRGCFSHSSCPLGLNWYPGTKRKASDSGGSTSSEEEKKPKASKKKRKDGNPHRKPKNFAERLMRVLQDGIGQDTIWWVGDGKAIGIHSRNLRRGDMLSEHFNVKDYSVFIRNCNRW
jgi:HSF-type DNA-binding